MVHLRRCSTKYNLFYTFTKDCFILEGWQGDDEDDDVSRYLPHTCGCRQSGQSGQCDGRDSVLASCNKMTVRQTLEIHIGLMTWLHAKLILNNHFAGNYKLVFYKTFFLVLKSSFDWLENIQNNGGLVVWSLLSVIFVSIWLMMFKNFFTLFKILSAETFFPSAAICELYYCFVTTFRNCKPNWFQKEESDFNFHVSGKMFDVFIQVQVQERHQRNSFSTTVPLSPANYAQCCDNVVMMIQTLIIFIYYFVYLKVWQFWLLKWSSWWR